MWKRHGHRAKGERTDIDKRLRQLEGRFGGELSARRKGKTGLPMTIWIDDAKSYVQRGHGKSVRFQLDTGEPNPCFCGEMDLDGEIREPREAISGLSESDISELRNFVRNNKKALEHLADIEIDMDDIWPFVIKGGGVATAEQIAALDAHVEKLLGMPGEQH